LEFWPLILTTRTFLALGLGLCLGSAQALSLKDSKTFFSSLCCLMKNSSMKFNLILGYFNFEEGFQ